MNRTFRYLNITRFTKGQRIHFFVNIVIGVLITILYHSLEETSWGENAINSFFDILIRNENNIVSNNKLLMIDIDQETYKKWGNPLLTPRDKLANIINQAYIGGARVVIIDILFEHDDCCNPEGDVQMRDVLNRISHNGKPFTIVFASRIINGELSKSAFDDIIGSDVNHFQRGVAVVSLTESDQVVRYWTPFEIAHDKIKNQDQFIWSIPILASVSGSGNMNELDTIAKDLKSGSDLKKEFIIHLKDNVSVAIPTLNDELYLDRIRFYLRPHTGSALANSISAQNVIEPRDDLSRDRFYERFKDKIVLVGHSSEEMGDFSLTPLGVMPSFYVLGNAINTMLNGLQPKSAPLWLFLIMEVFTIVISAYLFLLLRAGIAQIVGSIILILVFLPVSWYFFSCFGVMLNFVFPVMGMGLHEIISQVENIFDQGIRLKN